MNIHNLVSIRNTVIQPSMEKLELPRFKPQYKFPSSFVILANQIDLALLRFDIPYILDRIDRFQEFDMYQRPAFLFHFSRLIKGATYDLIDDIGYTKLAQTVHYRLHSNKLTVQALVLHIGGVCPARYPFTEVPCV